MNSFLKFNRYCLSKKSFFHKCYKTFLIHIQINSFNNFLISNKKKNYCIKNIVKKNFPIFDIKKNYFLKIDKIIINKPLFDESYCKKRNIHYHSIVYINLKIYFIKKKFLFSKKYELGCIPYMTKRGSFVINGTERVLISQFIKSHGIYFFTDKKKYCKIIPYYGNWIDLVFTNDLYFVFDKKIIFCVKNLLISIGIDKKFFFNFFFLNIKIKIIKGKSKKFFLINKKFFFDKKYNLLFCFSIKKIINGVYGKNYFLKKNNSYIYKFFSISKKNINNLLKNKFNFLNIIFLKKNIYNKGIIFLYKNYRFNLEENTYLNKKGKLFNFFKKLFYKKYYNFSFVGCKRIDKILFNNNKIVTINTFLEIIKKFFKFIKFDILDDELDSLENKTIYNSGKLLSMKFEQSFKKVIKNIKYKIKKFNNIDDFDVLIEKDIITIDLKDYFCNNELSQFLDQNNPLSEISHTRKISLISGNLKKENCGFEIRDLHISHYCKICPIDTPEGHNIGLINSFSFLSKINKYNYISTVYKICLYGKIIGIIFLDYREEKLKNIINVFSTNKTIYGEIFLFPLNEIRNKNNYYRKKFFFVDLIEISENQMFSIGAALIPFLENNDANRCLMGSNMQKQAVPLINSDNPIVGTGNELVIGLNSNYNILSESNGVVIYVDNYTIIIKNNYNIKFYKIKNFIRTNQNTVIIQKPIVNIGNYVNRGTILACSNVTKNGEISLGKNLRVAFMSWYGFNFEDSILISSKIIEKQSFSSFHIYEYICVLKYNENGAEIISDDCFNENQIKNKKIKNGIIKVGEWVRSKDVLVGKMVPRNKESFSSEEKLFKIVFSDNNFNYFEQPLFLSKNINGNVLEIDDFKLFSFKKSVLKVLNIEQLKYVTRNLNNCFYELSLYYFLKIIHYLLNKKVFLKKKIFIFNRNNLNILLNIKIVNKKDNFKLNILKKIFLKKLFEKKKIYISKKEKFLKYSDFEKNIIRIIKIKIIVKKKLRIGDKMSGRHGNKGVISNIINHLNMPYDSFGKSVDIILNPLGIPSRMNVGQLIEVYLGSAIKEIRLFFKKINSKNFSFYKLRMFLKILIKIIFNKNINLNLINNDDCYSIYIKMKNFFICIHNFCEFDNSIVRMINNKIGISNNGKLQLFDGITGIKYLKKINVGYIYFMKLNHLVIDKIYSRSIGPYSLVTQQPLGGKGNFGGQRLGEMEVWALEAYGSAYILKEMLTLKSDDVEGRVMLFKNIMKGIPHVDSGIPESFQILVREIKSLCLDLKII
ncbi:DNA-directed RNA polymerase subunit beta [Candidatus Carsonella ruddii]|uniref:DNA-directed RNA polymerase subunit beta n=1 Tax=Carsonella ruddii TaxID=114186 RepID=UPI003D81BCC9